MVQLDTLTHLPPLTSGCTPCYSRRVDVSGESQSAASPSRLSNSQRLRGLRRESKRADELSMPSMPSTSKQRVQAEYDEKEQLSAASATGTDELPTAERNDTSPADRTEPSKQTRRLLVRRSPATARHSASATEQPSSALPNRALPSAASPHSTAPSRRRVLLVRRSATDSRHSPLPPISRHDGATAHTAHSSPREPTAAAPSATAASTRERRILSRLSASSAAFSAFQSALASRVARPAASLCTTHSSDEYRLRVERAGLNEHDRRIARQLAAAHFDSKGAAAAESEGGLALPWEQSLRGATNHSVGVGGLFSGLYCNITQADMRQMEIVRSVKLITEQPALGTAPQQRSRAGRTSGAAAGCDQSAAAVRLLDEAGRLHQLSRLVTLGSQAGRPSRRSAVDGSREQAACSEQQATSDEASLRLGDLIVRGTPLFDDLDPTARLAESDKAGAADVDRLPLLAPTAQSESHADGGGAVESLSGATPAAFVLSSGSLAVQQTHFPHAVHSAPFTLHNPTHSTLHFTFCRLSQQSAFDECSAALAARPAFVLSPSSGYVLPRATIRLCATFCPPAAGLWVERWQLRHVDHDGEAPPLADAALTLAGSSRPPPVPHNTAGADKQSHTQLSGSTLQERFTVARAHSVVDAPLVDSLPSFSASASASLFRSSAALRSAFCSANGSGRLHFHGWLWPRWTTLWSDVRQLHRPLDRQRMQWQLSAEHIERSIEQLPARHRQQQPALLARLRELQALSAVVPSPDPTRSALLSSLLSALSAALPPFASQLRLLHKHSQQPPWTVRAQAAERSTMEWEDSAGHMTDEQRQQASDERRARQQQNEQREEEAEQALVEGVPQQELDDSAVAGGADAGERAKRLEEAAWTRQAEEREDGEWRQRDGEYRQRLEAECGLVLLGLVRAFEQRAGAMGSEQPPLHVEQVAADTREATQLPVAFPSLAIELEPEPAPDKSKGKASKGKR